MEELRTLAKSGDLTALQALRDQGFFQDREVGKPGFPVSHAQRRFWVLDQLEKNAAFYNISEAVIFQGDLNAAALENALHALIQRHESLRTTFTDFTGEPRQLVHAKIDFHLERRDLSAEAQAEQLARETAVQESLTPFDLRQGPLLRALLLKLAEDRHVFLFTIHHSVCDAWSMGILLRETMTLYAAYADGQENPLPPLKLQYKDYAAWQKALMKDESSQSHRAYWHNKLRGEVPALELPLDRARPPFQTFHGASAQFAIDPDASAALREFCQERGVSLFMALCALLKVLLFRYTGQADILVGSPTAGRLHPALEDQVGCYINTLALRDRLTPETSFETLLQQVKQTAIEAYEHQAYPFDSLVEELDLPRRLNRSPLFDVMIALQNIERPAFSLTGVTLEPFEQPVHTSKFDLTFVFVETPQGIQGEIEYNTDLFFGDRIQRMIAHFSTLLASVLRDPQQPVSRLNLLPPAERQRLLEDFNNTSADYPQDATLASLFEAQVKATPDNTAVIFEEHALSYRTLNQQANRIAYLLRNEYQVQPDDRVGLLLDRSDRLLTAILGIVKAGAAYVPVDPHYPEDRIQYILEDSQCRVVLDEELFSKFLQQPPHVLPDLPSAAKSDHAAYVIYTSGSTGKPKGCVITHRNVVRLMKNNRQYFDFNERDVWIVAHSFCFDFSVWEMYGALLYGGKLIVPRHDDVRDVARLLRLVKQHRITVLNQTPSAFYRFSDAEEREAQHTLDQHLRYVIFGGERLEPAYLQTWTTHYPLETIRLINMYGITETTVHVTVYALRHADIYGKNEGSPIGRPIPETTVFVCSSAMELQPIGVPGEMYVGGSGVCRGYLGRDDLTAARFLKNPFKRGERLYRTGDIGQWRSDGTLAYLGRNDDQVQIRGFRVELGEITHCLLCHKAVNKAVVLARTTPEGSQEVIAYLVGKSGFDLQELRQYMRTSLPEYMIPSYLIPIEEIPMTPHGKVDAAALPKPEEASHSDGVTYETPRNETEQRLVEIWKTVLNRDVIGIHDNFFESGGHSLNATLLASKIHQVTGTSISLREIFQSPTIAELAALIHQNTPAVFTGIEPIPAAESYAVSHAQRRLWVIDKMSVNKVAYNIPRVNLLEGELNLESLSRAVQTLIERHESLRTTFFEIDGEPRQKIHALTEFANRQPFTVISVEEAAHPEQAARIHVQQALATPFDLEQGPLFTLRLIRLSATRHVCVLNMHHIISDGWSLDLLLRELLELYRAYAQDEPNPLLPLRIQYKDYAAWQNAFLAEKEVNTLRQYWREKLEGEIPALELPTDFPRPPVQTFRGKSAACLFPQPLAQGLRTLGAQYGESGATLFMTIAALVKVLLYRYTGQEGTIVGTPAAGREHADLEHQVGCYVNMLALRDTLTGDESFMTALKKVKQTVIDAHEHQAYPFDHLVEELNLTRDMGRSPLFDVVVALRNIEQPLPEMPGIRTLPFEYETDMSKFDVGFFFTEMEDGSLQLDIEYCSDLFLPERIQRMTEHLRELARSVTRQPHTAVKHLNLLPEWERQKVLVEFNDTQRNYPHTSTIVELFEEQVERAPGAMAIRHHNRMFTYGEFNASANQFAWHLRQKGVRPDTIVTIFEDRSPEMLIAIFGILKAGGAYLPIDIDAPPARVTAMLADSRSRLIVTRESVARDMLPHLSQGGREVLLLDRLAGQIEREDRGNPPHVNQPKDLIYVMYTSGSTGIPKGVAAEHRNVVNLVKNSNYTRIRPSDHLLQLSNYAFDGSTFDIFGALLNGAALHLIDKELLYDLERLCEMITAQQINITFITTALINKLIDTKPEAISAFDAIYFGGQEASLRHIRTALRYRKTPDSIVHVYGPTEGTTFSTYYVIPDIPDHAGSIPIGAPISNTRAYILDADLRPVPIGIEGELYVSGDGVARGYLNQPEQTAARFVENPYAAGDRLYKTGDIAKWLPDGNIDFCGRRDEQIKIRGFRVELGEIEHALLSYPLIRQAFAMTRPTADGNKELVAYLVGQANLHASDIREHLSHRLPDYMLPSYYVQLDALPLHSTTGKVDRNALPDPEQFSLDTGATYEAPRNAPEQLLAEIWQSVLGRQQVGIHDNYFDAGGDSIKAIQLLSRLKQRGWTLEIRDVFLSPTIAELAPLLRKVEQIADQSVVEGVTPLTAIQRWFFETHNGEIQHFNQAVLLKSRARVDAEALRHALNKLQEHHDALRMTFHCEAGQATQINAGLPYPLSFDVIDLRYDSGAADMETHINKSHRSFNLANGPLMKAVLYRLNEGDRLLIVIHHLVVDGVSWRILLEDLEQSYRQSLAGEPVKFAPKTASFKQWAEEVSRYASRADFRKEIEYWDVNYAAGTSGQAERATGDNAYGACRTASISLSPEATDALLTKTSHAYHTEINDLLLTALARALKRWRGEPRAWMTLEGHGREPLEFEIDVSRTVGWFTSMYPFLLELPDDDDLGRQIKHVKEALRKVPQKGIGFGILRYVAPDEKRQSLRDVPLSDISFNYLGQFDDKPEEGFFIFAEEFSGHAVNPELQRQHALDIVGLIARGQFHLSITFHPSRHRPESIEKLCADFHDELLTVIKHCQMKEESEKTISDFTYSDLSMDEYASILKQLQ